MKKWPWKTPECGVYFDLSFEEYLSIPCLNASGIKELNISETDFWARSWMNQDNEYIDEDTKAKMEGRAYHKRILEGKNEFYRQYALEYEDDGDENIIRGNHEMKEALSAAGVTGLSSKSAQALSELCEIHLPHRPTIYGLKKSHMDAAGGRELISPKLMRHIEFTAKMIELHPDTRDYFVGGYSEVTVIFEMWGVKFKIRFDYLKVWECLDLKTFANVMRAELNKAVRKAFANNKYHIQGALYLAGVEHAKEYARIGKVFGFEKVEKDARKRERWLGMFAENPCNELKYAFVQKGVAPAVIPLVFSRKEKGFDMGMEVIKNGVDRFKAAYEKYGESYWVTNIREERAHYDEMPPWINDV